MHYIFIASRTPAQGYALRYWYLNCSVILSPVINSTVSSAQPVIWALVDKLSIHEEYFDNDVQYNKNTQENRSAYTCIQVIGTISSTGRYMYFCYLCYTWPRLICYLYYRGGRFATSTFYVMLVLFDKHLLSREFLIHVYILVEEIPQFQRDPSHPAFWWIDDYGNELKWSFPELSELSRRYRQKRYDNRTRFASSMKNKLFKILTFTLM